MGRRVEVARARFDTAPIEGAPATVTLQLPIPVPVVPDPGREMVVPLSAGFYRGEGGWAIGTLIPRLGEVPLLDSDMSQIDTAPVYLAPPGLTYADNVMVPLPYTAPYDDGALGGS